MKYEGGYLWPPRPEGKIPAAVLPMYERRKWWAQVKKNGTCTLIFCNPDTGEVRFGTRHGESEPHKAWTPLAEHTRFFTEAAPGKGWQVYVAELLHSKTLHIKNQLYLFDQIVRDGEQLAGSTFAQRQDWLHARFAGRAAGFAVGTRPPAGLGSYPVSDYVSIAKSFDRDFGPLWNRLQAEDEGLVLKDPLAPLLPCITPTANEGWQVKARRPTKNFSF